MLPINTFVTPEVKATITELAHQDGRTVSNYVARLLELHIHDGARIRAMESAGKPGKTSG